MKTKVFATMFVLIASLACSLFSNIPSPSTSATLVI